MNRLQGLLPVLRNRYVASLLAGVLLAFSFPPYDLIVLLPFAFGLLYFLIRTTGPNVTARMTAGFGVSFYLLHTYWLIGFQPVIFPVMLIGLGLVYGAWGFVLGLVGVNPWTTAASWPLLKFFLEHFALAFPWARLASVLTAYPGLIQPVALLGEVGWGTLILLTVLLVTESLLERKRRTILAGTLVGILVLGTLIWGSVRLRTLESEPINQSVLLVQPGVSMDWWNHDRENYRTKLSRRLTTLSQQHARPGDVLFWPEASVLGEPITFRSNGPHVRRSGGWPAYFESVLGPNNHLLFGTLANSPHPTKLDGLNLAVLLDQRAGILGYYSKQIPVPGTEYIPYMERSNLLRHLGQWLGTTGVRPGPNGGLIPLPVGKRTLRLGVQICYEDSFGHYVKNQVHRGADVLVNISNDGWSDSRGFHEQHFSRAVVRAVETGRSLLRVGTTGITAIVSPLGQTVERLDPFDEGVVRGRPLEPLKATVYVRWSHLITPLLFVLLAGLGYVETRWRIIESENNESTPEFPNKIDGGTPS